MNRKAIRARKRARTAMAAVAVCALVGVTSPIDAGHLPQYVASDKAMIAAVDPAPQPARPSKAEAAPVSTTRPITEDDLPRVESMQTVRSRSLSPKIASAVATAKRLDAARALDWRLRSIYRARLVSAVNILELRRCVEIEAFAHVIRGWKPAARHQICGIDDVVLFAHDGRPTVEMEEVWDGFRRRIRREGALQRILDGNIVTSRRETASEPQRLVA